MSKRVANKKGRKGARNRGPQRRAINREQRFRQNVQRSAVALASQWMGQMHAAKIAEKQKEPWFRLKSAVKGLFKRKVNP